MVNRKKMHQSTVVEAVAYSGESAKDPYGFDFVAEPSQLPEYSRQGRSAGCIDSMVAESYRTYRLSTSAAMTQLRMRLTGARRDKHHILYIIS